MNNAQGTFLLNGRRLSQLLFSWQEIELWSKEHCFVHDKLYFVNNKCFFSDGNELSFGCILLHFLLQLEGSIGYARWVCRCIHDASTMKNKALRYGIESMAAVPMASDGLVKYTSQYWKLHFTYIHNLSISPIGYMRFNI